jgi:hypothetical protein
VGNVTLPTPVFVAGGALCLLAGYLVGAVAGPNTPDRTTATVSSFDGTTGRLCLTGEAVKDLSAADSKGVLCGTWRRSGASSTVPGKGDRFRFVTVTSKGADAKPTSVIYGDVVK